MNYCHSCQYYYYKWRRLSVRYLPVSFLQILLVLPVMRPVMGFTSKTGLYSTVMGFLGGNLEKLRVLLYYIYL